MRLIYLCPSPTLFWNATYQHVLPTYFNTFYGIEDWPAMKKDQGKSESPDPSAPKPEKIEDDSSASKQVKTSPDRKVGVTW